MKHSYLILVSIFSMLLFWSCSSDNTTYYTLTIQTVPSAGGTVTPSQGEFEKGKEVELSAEPNEGFRFEGWHGDYSGKSSVAIIKMDSSMVIAAMFVGQDYPLTIHIEGEGEVSQEVISSKTDHPHGTTVELTALPDQGWYFSHWEGDLESSENPETVTVESEVEITVVFERLDFPLAIHVEGDGSVSQQVVQPKTTDYTYETVVELTAEPETGWAFLRWEGDLESTDNPAEITMDEEKEVTAVFEQNEYTLTVLIEGEGEVEQTLIGAKQTDYPFGSSVSLEAFAAENWSFSHWNGNQDHTDNPTVVTVRGDTTITANFSLVPSVPDTPIITDVIAGDEEITVHFEAPEDDGGSRITHYEYRLNFVTGDPDVDIGPDSPFTIREGENDGGGHYQIINGEEYVVRLRAVNAAGPGERVSSDPVTPHAGGVFLGENGVTIMCPNASVGYRGMVNGIEYEVVDRDLLEQRRNAGADLTKVCTSLVTDMSRLFYGVSFNQEIGNWDVSNVIDMSEMFSHSTIFNQDISNWDVSNVTNMSKMFIVGFPGLHLFDQKIGNWDVSNVINMDSMFHGSNFNQDISSWNVSKVKNMNNMFQATPSFNQDIGNWAVGSVIDMSGMFALSIFNQDIGNWDVSNVTDMSGMFAGISNELRSISTKFNQDIGDWDVSNVTNMSRMFNLNGSFNQDISNWNVSNVTNMSYMFGYAFNQDINKWDVSSVTSMERMFSGSTFDHDISSWNVRNVTNMSGMFFYSKFNQNIGDWDVSNVTDMSEMFYYAESFNKNIGDWDVSNVTDMSYMFAGYTNIRSMYDQDISKWDVSNVTDMSNMFFQAKNFNQDIGNWVVSNVTNMRNMFFDTPFNQDIGNWDVSNVTNMSNMFFDTPFDQDISNWNVSSVINMSRMFSETPFNQDIGKWDVSNITNIYYMQEMFFNAKSFNQDLSEWCVSSFSFMPFDFDTGADAWALPRPVWGTCPEVANF